MEMNNGNTHLLQVLPGKTVRFLQNFYWTKDMMFMVSSVVHQLIIGSVLLI